MIRLWILSTILICELSCSRKKDNLNSGNQNPADTTISTNNIDHKMTNYFPFEIFDNDGQFTITASTESPELYPKYADFFEKHGYSGNGYCWEGHIVQILEKRNKCIRQRLTHEKLYIELQLNFYLKIQTYFPSKLGN